MGIVRNILRDQAGAVVIETAFVAPVLILMAVGAFEAGNIFARQVELQNAAAEAAQIAIAAPPTDQAGRDTLKSVVVASTKLATNNVTVSEKYRCGTDTAYVDSATSCTAEFASFVQINLQDTYTPLWKQIAFGSDINYNITRLVQIG